MRMEALLNAFVRFVALLERTGNALGTLGFVWASVVVLGGFSNNLGDDFWVATVIVFLEAFRAFSRQSRSDDQFLFKTTGGIKLKRVALASSSSSLYYVNAVILTVCLWMLPTQYIIVYHLPRSSIPGYDGFIILFVLVMVEKLRFYKFIGYMSTKESHILLQLSPAAAIPLIALARYYLERHHSFGWKFCILISQWFTVYTLARFGSPGDHTPFHRGVKAAAKLLRGTVLCTTTLQLSLNFKEPMGFVILVGPLFLGNLQTPLALARIILSWGWLFRREIEVYETDNENVKLAVKVLYIMVMCQGILYMAACILESISFLPRRSLALGCGLVDKLGMESVDLYYEQAYDTFLQERLFDTTKEMGLVTFAVDSLNSGASWEKKRAAVRILDSFLQRHRNSSSSNTEIVSLITTSTKAVKTLISMLGWTVPKDADIRLFATKVTTQLAPHLRIVGIPGTMQMVSSLLDAQDELEREDISTRTVEGIGGNVDNHQISNGSSSPRDIEGGHTPGVQISSVQATRNSKRCCLVEWICRSLQYVEDLQSVPQEDSKDMELLPALGMQILEGLAHDLHNCAEIGRATQILQKVIGFISCITGITTVKREKIGTPSLRLVARLARVTGQIGITLRQELSKNPFLIGNLAEILVFEDSSSYLAQSQLAMDIIAKLAKDKNTRQKIGRIQVIIDKLVQEFLGEDEPRKRRRAAAGKALAILARESLENCSAMLKDEPDYVLMADLANKLQGGEHVYTAASLLQILCKNCREVMCTQGPSDHLLSTLKGVMGGIVDAEGKQMDALIGLASQLCGVLSEKITPVLESFQNDETFVEKLVDELNAHKKPTPDESPNIRTRLVGLTISILEFCPRYGSIFREHRMVEALSKVEQYMVLYGSGSAGVVIGEPTGDLPTLVARAKLLIDANIAPV